MQTLEAILAEHPFFEGFEPRYMQLITGCASNVRFKPGTISFARAKQAEHFYIIRQGKVALETFAALSAARSLSRRSKRARCWAGRGCFRPIAGISVRVPMKETRAIALDGVCLRAKGEADHDLGYELVKRVAQIMMERLQATRLQLLDIYRSCGKRT